MFIYNLPENNDIERDRLCNIFLRSNRSYLFLEILYILKYYNANTIINNIKDYYKDIIKEVRWDYLYSDIKLLTRIDKKLIEVIDTANNNRYKKIFKEYKKFITNEENNLVESIIENGCNLLKEEIEHLFF